MEAKQRLKNEIVNQIRKKLNATIDEINRNMAFARESRDNETKSSVGDKYETGREMANMEMEKLNMQLSKTMILLNEVGKLNVQKEYNTIGFGSLVFTNKANYFISFGLGKVDVANETFFCISLESPIGKALSGKKQGDVVRFQNNEIVIKNIA